MGLCATAQTIESTNLIPLHSDLVHLIRAAEDLSSVDDAIVRNLDVVLVATMTVLYKLHQQLKESPYGGDQSRQQRMHELRAKARSLMTFAGMVRLGFRSRLRLSHCADGAVGLSGDAHSCGTG